jgi:hypothetical protein
MIDYFFKYELRKNEENIRTWCKDVCYANIPLIKNVFDMYPEYKNRLYSDYVESNPFIHPYIKIVILNTYCDSKQKLNTLKNVCIRYIRKRRTSHSTTDLSLRPLVEMKPIELIDIMHDYKKYTFRIFDLSNIIFNSLTNSDEFLFPVPLRVKNPYTNIAFSVKTLYIIYFCMLTRGFIIHPLFSLFMKENFNLAIFSLKYEGLVKEYIIDNKIKQYTTATTCKELRTMFDELTIYSLATLEFTPILSNSDKIPDSILVGFKSLLYHYNHSLYSMNSSYRHTEYNKLIKKIIAFMNENPYFTVNYRITVPITKVNYKHITIPRRSYSIDSIMLIP